MSKFLSLAVHEPVVKRLGYQRLNEINPVTRSRGKRRFCDKWEGHKISQATEDFVFNGVVIPAGYVNATEMCRANDKRWGNYKQQIGVSEYWQALGDSAGIPVESLILAVQGYATDHSVWVYPHIATDLAQWVSVRNCKQHASRANDRA